MLPGLEPEDPIEKFLYHLRTVLYEAIVAYCGKIQKVIKLRCVFLTSRLWSQFYHMYFSRVQHFKNKFLLLPGIPCFFQQITH